MRTVQILHATVVSLMCGGACWGPATAQTAKLLRATAKHPAEQRSSGLKLSATTEVYADVTGRLLRADGAQRGEVWLEVFAQNLGHGGVTLRVPLSSTGDAYGESRSCVEGPGGGYEPVFSAGLDEKNFTAFRAAKDTKEFHLLLNKYLCRALAAPFQCFGKRIDLPKDWSQWSFGSATTIRLSSDAPSTLAASAVRVTSSGKAFDSVQCAVIAPSNGMCCVQHKTTEWHCGGKPSGEGWHQVSGDCYHRETGGTCVK